MENPEENKRKRKAAFITIGFHLIVLVLFLFFGLTQPVPLPDDAGASIEFGWDEAASGDAVAMVENNTPVQQESPAPEETEEVIEEAPVEEVVTADESEVSVPEAKEEKPKVEEKPKPVEEPKPTLSDELSKALESLSSPSGGGSQGDQTGTGDQGNPEGTMGKGALGGGSGSWQLDGRSMLPGYGTKIRDTREEGIVVLNITVDRSGKVTAVSPNLKESNTTSQYLINLAKNDVLNNFRFNGDPSAAIEQRGKVRYVFKLD
jgi:outer membrane biosynthesis protein TonB